MDPEPESVAVGRQIRNLREARQLTMKQLAERIGFSVSYLSLIENGHANHSLKILREIARVLNVPMIDFLVAEPDQEISVVRAADRRTYTLKTGADESLLYGKHRFELQTTLLHLPPGTSSGEPSRHPGEENTFVLEGRVRICIGASQPLDLDEGDIAYYPSSLPHRWENPFNGDAKILITNTPSTY